jgi:tetratricopeptide (TPR) repeat protein
MKRVMIVLAVIVLVGVGSRLVSYASGTSSSSMQSHNNTDNSAYEKSQEIAGLYEKGIEAGKANDYEKAIDFFGQALDKDPQNADVLNMLAHAQRKTGKIGEALENYKKALAIRPDFAEAREYLGETYIQAALQEAATLKSYGDKGKEQLEDLTEAFKDAEETLKDKKKDPN